MEQLFSLPKTHLLDKPTYLAFVQGSSLFSQGVLRCSINSRGQEVIRETHIGDPVSCYRNLNKPAMFSIMQSTGVNKGRVSGYAPVIVIKGSEKHPLSVKVSEASRQRVLNQKRKKCTRKTTWDSL